MVTSRHKFRTRRDYLIKKACLTGRDELAKGIMEGGEIEKSKLVKSSVVSCRQWCARVVARYNEWAYESSFSVKC